MYIRKTVRRYKDKTYVNFLLVESILTEKGPRHKVICSLGDLSPRPPEQWLALARELQGATVRDLLATHEIATIVLPTDQNGVLRIRRSATPEPDHRVLYEALGVPTEIIRPVKTWEKNQPNSD